MKTNILVTSISKKVPMIKAVRSAIERIGSPALLYGADLSDDCVAMYFVDRFWKSPDFSEMQSEDLIAFCKRENISVIFPSRDGELLFFANAYEEFKKNNISVMISKPEGVRACIDKLIFHETLFDKGLPTIPTYLDVRQPESVSEWVVKERYGAASAGIGLRLTPAAAVEHALYMKDPIFQPMISGDEYSIDVYMSSQCEAVGASVRRRDKVVHGESQITSSKAHPVLEQLCMKAAEVLNLRGHVIFQAIVDHHNQVHLIECNCRFGGASTLSIAMGLDSFRWFIMESANESVEKFLFERSGQEKKMIRYAEDLIL
ncbi:ATP-grasp domain-containing protein [Saccharibacillus endophyticus]|uniref:ATP-grasp domain-containing protein n=1 Tax=Saccharibacillus endophyticus TaxID=2060666 RepID=A0ABQ2A9D9_9BACL|nr:ATP-grasp domain-containing protein [Saccharibacillus endophyticus]GGH86989.1 hypothetical protein GCM10007362_48060 [Saccharibacillus endophyticus]